MEIEVLERFASAVKVEIGGEGGRKEKEAKFKDGEVSLQLLTQFRRSHLNLRTISGS
jgi:hypothetical protein